MTTYSEKLKDPRWQKKRLEILNRDNWICQWCEAKDEQLHVHHRLYLKKRYPWDYPDRLLLTVCATCHAEHGAGEEAALPFVDAILEAGADAADIESLAFAFEHILPVMGPEQWRVFDHHFTNLAFAMLKDYGRLKAEHQAHVNTSPFEEVHG